MVFYCTADDTGPLDPVDWSALPKAARAACPSHVVRSGNGPRVAPNRAATADELAECEAILAAAGHDIDATTDAGEPLRCPVCLAPLRASASAETWVPPEGLPADPVPTVRYRPKQGTVVLASTEAVTATGEAWQVLGAFPTSAARWVDDVAASRVGLVGTAAVESGTLTARLIEASVDGSERVLASVVLSASAPIFEALSDVAPSASPCTYRTEAQVSEGGSATIGGVSVALYEPQP